MAYSKALDKRIIDFISHWDNVIPREMFGGGCYLLNGNMVCGVYKDFLILRLGIEGAALALQHSRVRAFDITGRAMKGWVMVEEKGCAGGWMPGGAEQAEGL